MLWVLFIAYQQKHPKHELMGTMTLVIIMLATLFGTTPCIWLKEGWQTALFEIPVNGRLSCTHEQPTVRRL